MTLHVHFPRWLVSAKLWLLNHLTHLKVVWSIWDLRTFILVSLCFQIILIFLGPFRKRTSNIVVISTIWLAYLLADYVATQAISLVPRYNAAATPRADAPHADLLSFWSPFLLVHLGGPDTITALALEDNELWMRTALHLCTQASATGRVFFQSLPTNLLWLPTILMFIAGLLRYLERTLSLFYARLTKFKSSLMAPPNPGVNYTRLMQAYNGRYYSFMPIRFETRGPPVNEECEIKEKVLSEDENDEEMCDPKCERHGCFDKFKTELKETRKNMRLLSDAFNYFNKYKGLYVDLIFSSSDRENSRADFLSRSPEEAFTIVEMELNFAYEVFFTKMLVIHQRFGTIIRLISVVCEVLSFLVWALFIDKQLFHGIDIRITYALLGGAIVLDAIAILRVLLSDWNMALLNKDSGMRAYLYDKVLSARSGDWGNKGSKIWQRLRKVFFGRWSESVGQFSLMNYCVDDWSGVAQFLFRIIPIKDNLDTVKYVSRKRVTADLKDFIFKEIRYKSEFALETKEGEKISDSRGEWVIRALATSGSLPSELYPWTISVDYDESLLTWHIATELLLDAELPNAFKWLEEELSDMAREERKYRNYCKTLSDYAMYLLIQRPGMMSTVAGISEMRVRDTCAEVTAFFDTTQFRATTDTSKEARQDRARKSIMMTRTDVDPRDIKGDGSKSVLFQACRLAKELTEPRRGMVGAERWEFMAAVWVELLCYAASHCKPDAHASQLKQGGELLTLVWLLMVHFGLGKQFRTLDEFGRASLVDSRR